MNDTELLTTQYGIFLTHSELENLINSIVESKLRDSSVDINCKTLTTNGAINCNGRLNVYPDPVQNYGGGEIVVWPANVKCPSMHIDNNSNHYRIWSRPAGYPVGTNDFTTVEWNNDTQYIITYSSETKHDITPIS